jgi:arginine repressor
MVTMDNNGQWYFLPIELSIQQPKKQDFMVMVKTKPGFANEAIKVLTDPVSCKWVTSNASIVNTHSLV